MFISGYGQIEFPRENRILELTNYKMYFYKNHILFRFQSEEGTLFYFYDTVRKQMRVWLDGDNNSFNYGIYDMLNADEAMLVPYFRFFMILEAAKNRVPPFQNYRLEVEEHEYGSNIKIIHHRRPVEGGYLEAVAEFKLDFDGRFLEFKHALQGETGSPLTDNQLIAQGTYFDHDEKTGFPMSYLEISNEYDETIGDLSPKRKVTMNFSSIKKITESTEIEDIIDNLSSGLKEHIQSTPNIPGRAAESAEQQTANYQETFSQSIKSQIKRTQLRRTITYVAVALGIVAIILAIRRRRLNGEGN
jgi:hypothetical protein